MILLQLSGAEKLKVNGIEITPKEGSSSINATIYNNDKEKMEGGKVYVLVKNKEGSVILKAAVYIDDIEANGETGIQIATKRDLSNAYSYTIEKE